MDGVSAAASVIALVQAGGMLLKVGKAFHETFISKDNDHRADDASLRVASTEEFIQKIELFQAIKLISSPTITSSAPTSGQHATAISATPGTGPNSPPQPGIDHVLKNCKEQLSRLQVKVRKMIVPRDAKKFKRLVGAVRLKLNEPEFAQIDATIMLLLQQLTFFMTMAQFQLSQDR